MKKFCTRKLALKNLSQKIRKSWNWKKNLVEKLCGKVPS